MVRRVVVSLSLRRTALRAIAVLSWRPSRCGVDSVASLPGLNGVCQCQGNHRTPVACDSSVLVSSCARYPAVWPTVFFGVYDLAPTIGPVQPHAMLIGYIFAFRWVLNDQRRRCPECLRRCGNLVHIGHPPYVLLAWYGTEFICPEGHGLLQVPHLPKASFSPQRWLRLDASCAARFPETSSVGGTAAACGKGCFRQPFPITT